MYEVKLKGLYMMIAFVFIFNVPAYYSSTRKQSRLINNDGKNTVAIVHNIDSYIGEKPQWFELCDMKNFKDASTIWFSDRMKYCRNFNRIQLFKDEGIDLYAKIRKVLPNWQDILGISSGDASSSSNTNIDNDNGSILRDEFSYQDILNTLEHEQYRVARCMSELAKGVKVLTDMIVGVQILAPNFKFGPDAITIVDYMSLVLVHIVIQWMLDAKCT
ncbi:hypothetical protein BDA99DRAFT_533360 [Phascolomyces articulosus]|uniref:Uncharacterized protein n=1 Tax=Phascolomyces articulosus TaxID=60185 RepID=A0AAD5PIP4_9FUNG|nr:hypothetical protein BDA99DRAFT_533360 [Phascolomyces articulosus]